MSTVDTISLGAGVQSSTMALMASKGLFPHMPTCAIFADTGDEPRSVYRWLDYLEPLLAFPLVRVSIGNLGMAATANRTSKAGNGYLSPALPAFFDTEGKKGKGNRHCTVDFKIKPIERYANLIRKSGKVRMWIGISTDEAVRIAAPRKEWIENYYPLIDHGMNRDDCLAWMKEHGYDQPPRSACVYCPFHSDDEWLRLKTEEPEAFTKAVAFEKLYQEAAAKSALDGIPYLHEERKPLTEVQFRPGRGKRRFGNECKGMCGV